MKHANPTYREVKSYNPSQLLSREQAWTMLDRACMQSDDVISRIRSALREEGLEPLPDTKLETPRRWYAREFNLDFPEIRFAKDNMKFAARSCITGTGAFGKETTHHKLKIRVNLTEFKCEAPNELSFGELAAFYAVASSVSTILNRCVWDCYTSLSGKVVPKVSFDEIARLVVKFYDTSREDGRKIEALVGSTDKVKSVLKDDSGRHLFSELVSLEQQDAHVNPASHPEDLSQETISEFLDEQSARVFQFAPPSMMGSAVCVEIDKPHYKSIVGAGYSKEGEEKSLSYEGSRALASIHSMTL